MKPSPDPVMAKILAQLKAAPTVDLRRLPPGEARAAFTQAQEPWVWAPTPMAATRELEVPGAAGPLRARLYLPSDAPGLPVVIFAHGGGWTFGSVDTHDGSMRILATESGCAVLGFDYRLAPEHPFPAPLDDVLAVLAFVESGGLGPACDPARIALSGDSAGANLALGALITRRDAGGPMPTTAALFYGCYAPIFDTDSHRRLGDGTWLLGTEMMRWYWRNFLGEIAGAAAPPASTPLHADLAGLPPLYLNAAGLDPLLDDTTLLAQRLASAGVRYRLDIWPGVVHGFHRLARDLPLARTALAAAGTYLNTALNDKKPGGSTNGAPQIS